MNFYIPKTHRLVQLMLLLMPYTNASAQSADKNYIQTKTFLDESASSFLRHIDYYDELGFVAETVDVGVNASATPLVTRTDYSATFKPLNKWAPIPSNTLDFIDDVDDLACAVYNDVFPYIMNEYGDFDKLSHTWKPGEIWDEHFTTITYKAVPAGVVRKYSVGSNGNLIDGGMYAGGILTSTTTIDGDGRQITVYTNMHENTILERRGTDNDTYYVYDGYGRLCYVLPPMCQQCSASDRSKYWYRYKYDSRGRCIEKQLPGCAVEKYWYDNANRIQSVQDGYLQESALFRNYKYDAFGRLTLQTLSTSRGEADMNNAEVVELKNYYDSNSFASEMATLFPEWADSIRAYNITPLIAKGKLMASLQATSNGNHFLEMYNYDAKGRVTYKLSAYDNKLMKIDYTTYNFVGDVTRVEEHVYKYNGAISHIAGHRTVTSYKSGTRLPSYEYMSNINKNGSLTTVRTNILSYDDFGNVIQSNRPGEYADISYTYDTLHGWLTGISSPCGFSEQLLREDAPNPQYSGNIGRLQWRNSNNGEVHKYDFTYDNLARLTNSQYSSSTIANNGHFNESVTYDCQGSITSLLRYGMKNNGTFGVIDDLSISYDGNRLLNVTDEADPLYYNGALDFNDGADQSVEYEYDSSGALVRDSNRGIDNIIYDYCHYPQFISMSNGQKTIEYDYTPDGRKLESKHNSQPWNVVPLASLNPIVNPIQTATTDTYIDGLILRNGNPLMWQFDGGYISLDANGNPTSWNYYITDHLGSTRMVVTSTNTITETINYYPYGSEMRMTDPALMANSTFKERFRFSGKELDFQNGLNMYDFGARMFDVAGVPMWTSVDPLCEDNFKTTPYSYCNGDPVNRFDPDGKDWYQTEDKSAAFWQEGSEEMKIIDDVEYKNAGDEFDVFYDWGAIHFNQDNMERDPVIWGETTKTEDIVDDVIDLSNNVSTITGFAEKTSFIKESQVATNILRRAGYASGSIATLGYLCKMNNNPTTENLSDGVVGIISTAVGIYQPHIGFGIGVVYEGGKYLSNYAGKFANNLSEYMNSKDFIIDAHNGCLPF